MFKAEFRVVIGPAVPLFVELLKSNEYSVRSSAASALVKLAENSEWQPTMIAKLLTHTQS
jgi:HEAT repeat